MIIYIAGNMPDREREEKELKKRKLFKTRLFSYWYLDEEPKVKLCFDLWLG